MGEIEARLDDSRAQIVETISVAAPALTRKAVVKGRADRNVPVPHKICKALRDLETNNIDVPATAVAEILEGDGRKHPLMPEAVKRIGSGFLRLVHQFDADTDIERFRHVFNGFARAYAERHNLVLTETMLLPPASEILKVQGREDVTSPAMTEPETARAAVTPPGEKSPYGRIARQRTDPGDAADFRGYFKSRYKRPEEMGEHEAAESMIRPPEILVLQQQWADRSTALWNLMDNVGKLQAPVYKRMNSRGKISEANEPFWAACAADLDQHAIEALALVHMRLFNSNWNKKDPNPISPRHHPENARLFYSFAYNLLPLPQGAKPYASSEDSQREDLRLGVEGAWKRWMERYKSEWRQEGKPAALGPLYSEAETIARLDALKTLAAEAKSYISRTDSPQHGQKSGNASPLRH